MYCSKFVCVCVRCVHASWCRRHRHRRDCFSCRAKKSSHASTFNRSVYHRLVWKRYLAPLPAILSTIFKTKSLMLTSSSLLLLLRQQYKWWTLFTIEICIAADTFDQRISVEVRQRERAQKRKYTHIRLDVPSTGSIDSIEHLSSRAICFMGASCFNRIVW